MKFKISPLHIVKFLYRFGIFFIAPIFEAIFLKGLPKEFFFPLYLSNLICIIFVLALGILSYKSLSFTKKPYTFRFCKGLFFREKSLIQTENITLTTFKKKPHYLLFLSRKVSFHSYNFKEEIYLRAKGTRLITDNTEPYKTIAKSKRLSVLSVAFATSNILPELLTIIPLIKQITSIFGKDMGKRLLTFLKIESDSLLAFIPHTLRLTVLIALIFWVVGTLSVFLSLYGLTLLESKNKLRVNFGLISQTTAYFTKEDIAALSQNQNLLSLLLSVKLCYCYLPVKGNLSRLPLYAGKDRKKLFEIRRSLGFICLSEKASLKLKSLSTWGYLYPPILTLSTISLITIFSYKYELSRIFTLPLAAISLIWFFIRLTAYKKSYIELYGSTLKIKSFKHLNINTTYLPLSSVSALKISRSPFQKISCQCSIKIYVKSAKRLSFKLTHTGYKKTTQLLKLCGL